MFVKGEDQKDTYLSVSASQNDSISSNWVNIGSTGLLATSRERNSSAEPQLSSLNANTYH